MHPFHPRMEEHRQFMRRMEERNRLWDQWKNANPNLTFTVDPNWGEKLKMQFIFTEKFRFISYIGRSRTKLVRNYVSSTNDRLRNFELYALPAMQKKIQDQEEAIATVEAQIQGKETLSTV